FIPARTTSTTTSSGPGSGSGRSTTSSTSGPPNSLIWTARTALESDESRSAAPEDPQQPVAADLVEPGLAAARPVDDEALDDPRPAEAEVEAVVALGVAGIVVLADPLGQRAAAAEPDPDARADRLAIAGGPGQIDLEPVAAPGHAARLYHVAARRELARRRGDQRIAAAVVVVVHPFDDRVADPAHVWDAGADERVPIAAPAGAAQRGQ